MNIGGAESYVATVAVGLKRRGHHVTVASWGGHLAKELAHKGIQHFLVPIRLHVGLAAWMLERIIKKQQIDIVHANSAAAGLAAVRVCRKLNLPCVYTAHGVLGHDVREQALSNADAIICVSDFLRNLCIERGFPEARLMTMYNGVNTEKFRPNPALGRKLRQSLGIGLDEFVIGIVSRIRNPYDKGHADLLEMIHQYAVQRPWKIMVVGKGRGLAKVKRQVKNLGLSQKVIFVGFQRDAQNIMTAMDVMVLPSNFETFGLVLAEANSVGIPVVAYAVGGTPEAVADGKTGFLVPKRNIFGLYEKLNQLAASKELRQQMGQAGRLRVQSEFNNEHMVDRLLELYEKHSSAAGRYGEKRYVSEYTHINVPPGGKSID